MVLWVMAHHEMVTKMAQIGLDTTANNRYRESDFLLSYQMLAKVVQCLSRENLHPAFSPPSGLWLSPA